LNLTLAAGFNPKTLHEYRAGAEETFANDGALLHIAISQACVPKWDIFLARGPELMYIVQALKDVRAMEDLDNDLRCQDDFLFLAILTLLGLLVACLKNGIDPQSRNKRGTSVTSYARKYGILALWKAALSEMGYDAEEVIANARDTETGWSHEHEIACKQKHKDIHDMAKGRARLEQSNGFFARDILSPASVLRLGTVAEPPLEYETSFVVKREVDLYSDAHLKVPGQWYE
jgi:hypothetical protein